jgi:hypothetical protein
VIERGKTWTVSIENNIVVNNAISIDNIEKRTKKKVVALEEKAVDNPDAASKADSTSVAIFIPEVKEQPAAKPKKTRKIEAKTLSKPKYQSTKQVNPNTNLRGAESWKINCSPRFGDFTKTSETYLSIAGRRVSCAMRPKNARG